MEHFPEYSCALSFKLRVVIIRDSLGNGGVSHVYAEEVIAGVQEAFAAYKIYFEFDGGLEYLDDTGALNAIPTSPVISGIINRGNNPADRISIYIGSSSGTRTGVAGGIPAIATYVKGNLLSDAGIGVVVHELGHCLGLYHTFQGSEGFCGFRVDNYDDTNPAVYCDTLFPPVDFYMCGDCVPDTPTAPWYFAGEGDEPYTVVLYDTSTQTCSINPFQPFFDVDIHNYMSYYQACYEHFTPGQVSRMKKAIHFVQYDDSIITRDHRFMENTLSDKLVITADTDWDEPIEVCTDVYIEAPNTLTITSTASMHPGVKDVVKPGAQLRLEGGVMTQVGSGYWKGIEVWGDANATQIPNTGQGKLYIGGGATIVLTSIYLSRSAMEHERSD